MRLLIPTQGLPSDFPTIENLIEILPRHKTKKYPTRNLDDVDTFVVHHMASENALVNQALYHINGKGWAGLGYHIVIWGNRVIQANYLDSRTNHTSGYNDRGIGVAILGDLSTRSITGTESSLLSGVLASLNTMLPGRLIKGHRECSPTACPCTDVGVIRNNVKTLEMSIAEQTSYTGSLSAMRAAAYAIAERVAVLGQRLHEPKFSEAAKLKLGWLLPVMDLVGGEKTIQGVVDRVMELYQTSLGAGLFSDEADRKILLFEPIMRERGVL